MKPGHKPDSRVPTRHVAESITESTETAHAGVRKPDVKPATPSRIAPAKGEGEGIFLRVDPAQLSAPTRATPTEMHLVIERDDLVQSVGALVNVALALEGVRDDVAESLKRAYTALATALDANAAPLVDMLEHLARDIYRGDA